MASSQKINLQSSYRTLQSQYRKTLKAIGKVAVDGTSGDYDLLKEYLTLLEGRIADVEKRLQDIQ